MIVIKHCHQINSSSCENKCEHSAFCITGRRCSHELCSGLGDAVMETQQLCDLSIIPPSPLFYQGEFFLLAHRPLLSLGHPRVLWLPGRLPQCFWFFKSLNLKEQKWVHLFSQFTQPSPSPASPSTCPFCMSASLFLPRRWVHLDHLSRFHIYALIYDICCSVSDLLHSVWQTLGPSTSLQKSDSVPFYGWHYCVYIQLCGYTHTHTHTHIVLLCGSVDV